jgi:SAM-dependent methyltransferase
MGDLKKQWYEVMFENFGQQYDQEEFTQGTLGECDFMETEFGFNKTLKILDVGCGTGRHSIELTRRGYNITGIDLSESQLKRAKEKAELLNLKINFLKEDGTTRTTYRSNTFDLMTFRDHSIVEFTDDAGNKKTIKSNERYYVPSEICWMLKSLGFTKIDIFGARLGAFSRNDTLTTEDFEMLVIAENNSE